MAWSNASGWSRSEGWNAGATGGGGGGGVTLDPANTGGGGTLSSDKLSLTYSSAQAASRSTTSHTSGKYYFETTYGPAMNAGANDGGLVNASASMTGGQFGTNVNSLGAPFADSGVYLNNAAITFVAPAPTAGVVVGWAVDISGSKLWATSNGTLWNNLGVADPVAGTNGADISPLTATGALFAAVHVEANSNSVMTINFGPTYTFTKPTGFSDW